jgi:hypothetical protein
VCCADVAAAQHHAQAASLIGPACWLYPATRCQPTRGL